MDFQAILDNIIVPLVITISNLLVSRKWIGNVKQDFKSKMNKLEVDLKNCIRSSRPYKAAFEDAVDAMLVVNNYGDIIMMNSAAEFLTGWSRVNLLNNPVGLLVPDSVTEVHRIWREGFFNRPQHRKMGINRNVYLKRLNGERIKVDIDLNPEMTSDNQVNVLVTIRENTIEDTQPMKPIRINKNE